MLIRFDSGVPLPFLLIRLRVGYMKSLEDVIAQYRMKALDGRDVKRLSMFLPEDRMGELGVEVKPEFVGQHVTVPYTREVIIGQLQEDVAFGFKKALNQRGISSSFMYDVVSMWNWVLEEGLENFNEYPLYGLPLFKATALKYGFDNPIGDDTGTEMKYAEY